MRRYRVSPLVLLPLTLHGYEQRDFCFDDQFNVNSCCGDTDMMPLCFQGNLELYNVCCSMAGKGPPIPYVALSNSPADVWCDGNFYQPDLKVARIIFKYAYDISELCRTMHMAVRQHNDEPVVSLLVSREYTSMFDNFISFFAAAALHAKQSAEPHVRHVMVFSFDAHTQAVCKALASVHKIIFTCLPPPSDGSLFAKTSYDEKGRNYYMINWMKVAATQLLLKIGASAALWCDTDIVVLKPLLFSYFSFRARRLQTECEATQIEGLKYFAAHGGFGFASQASMGVVASWVSSFNPYDTPEGRMAEMYSLREMSDAHSCLCISTFTRWTTRLEEVPARAVTLHAWLAGKLMTASVPRNITGHRERKIFKMREFGMWRPVLDVHQNG
eukprot:TRINITY_DN23094_c0_g1_i1.p1 TRINITY_DN23094_c0_g1~~TRINITY_DN23094_c0_g1_i1.p1  ORF type:complete len:386 (+),score=46.42 TRINITY_DN23094_c0_g1_i1:97-1254(+)